jgi:Domain of unknown function (DUF5679)
MSYCLKCREITPNSDEDIMYDKKNDRYLNTSECSKCGTKKCKFVSKEEAVSKLQGMGLDYDVDEEDDEDEEEDEEDDYDE